MKTLAAALISALLSSAIAGASFVNLTTANPVIGLKPLYHNLTILSPENEAFSKENVTFKFIAKTNWAESSISFCYTLDAGGEMLYGAIWNDFLKVEEKIISQVEITNDSFTPEILYDSYTETTFECTSTLPPLSYGNHNITIYRGINYERKDAIYSNLQTFYFTVAKPPEPKLEPESFPTAIALTAFGVSVAMVGAGLLVYFKKRNHTS